MQEGRLKHTVSSAEKIPVVSGAGGKVDTKYQQQEIQIGSGAGWKFDTHTHTHTVPTAGKYRLQLVQVGKLTHNTNSRKILIVASAGGRVDTQHQQQENTD